MTTIIKRYFTLFIFAIVLSATSSHARSLSPQEALDRALTATVHDKLSVLSSNADKAHYTLAKATPEYYVFNSEGGGYMIVSADDRIYEILADVENGSFNPDSIPGLKWITDLYAAEIREFITEDDMGHKATGQLSLTEEASTLPSLYAQWTDISPIMTTRWGQFSPYNDLCPIKNGVRSVTGCTATAMAQVVKAIGHYQGTGYKNIGSDERGNPIEFDYASAEFDLHGMKDVYDSESTAKEKNEIANLMLACGVGTNMKYSNEASGAFTRYVSTALIDHFGFDPDYTCLMKRQYFNAADWERVIYTELSLGRPVHYAGGNHAFVIDGYRRHGLYHVNWGWDGAQQGYFRLSALITPLTNDNFSSGQELSKSVPLGADPGYMPHDVQGLIGGLSCNPDGTLNISFTSRGVNPDTSLGIIILNENGKIVDRIVFWTGYNLFNSSTVRDPKKSYDFTALNLPAGVYSVYPAYKSGTETKLHVAGQHNSLPHYILLTVNADGQYDCSNMKSSIHLAEVSLPESCYSGYPADITLTMVNNMPMDYSGTLTISLVRDETDTDNTCSMQTDISIYSGDNKSATCTLFLCDNENNPLTPGTYTITVTDNYGIRVDDGEFVMTVSEGTPKNNWSSFENLRIENAEEIPEILSQGTIWPHTAQVVCSQSKKVNIGVTFYNPDKNTIVKNFYIYNSTINIGSKYYLYSADDFTIDIPFGTYDVAYTNNLSQISARKRVRISQESNGLWFAPKGENEASVTGLHPEYYSRDITIPEIIEFNGIEYPVTDINAGAFAGCASLQSVIIPSSVNHIGTNAFAYCGALEQIQLHSPIPSFKYINHIAPGLPNTCSIYTTCSAWESYNKNCKRDNLYSLIESIESRSIIADGSSQTILTVKPSHSAINKNFNIYPVDNSIDPVATISVSDVQTGHIVLDITPLRSGTQMFKIESHQLGIEPAFITLTVSDTSGIDSPETDTDISGNVEIMYNLHGQPIYDKSNCQAGIYIIVKGNKTEKIIIPHKK